MHEKVLSRVVRPYERHGRARTGTRHRHGSVLGDRLRPEPGPIPSGQPPLRRRAGTHAEWLRALSPARARARYSGLVHPSRIHDGTSLCLPAAAPAGPYGRGARDHRGASRSWGGSRRAPPHAQRRSAASRDRGAACKSDAASRIASTVARVGHGQFRRQRALYERVDKSPTSLPSTLAFRPTPGGVRAGIAIPRRVFGLLRAPLECRGTPTVGRGVLPAPPASSVRGVVSSSRAARSNNSSRSWVTLRGAEEG